MSPPARYVPLLVCATVASVFALVAISRSAIGHRFSAQYDSVPDLAPANESFLLETPEPQIYNPLSTAHLVYRRPFTNPWQRELYIDAIDTSCGCSSALLEPNPLGPGETGELSIHLRPDGIVGRKAIRLVLKPRDQPAMELGLDAPLYPAFRIREPDTILPLTPMRTAVPFELNCDFFSLDAGSLPEDVRIECVPDGRVRHQPVRKQSIEQLSDGVFHRAFHVVAETLPQSDQGVYSAKVIVTRLDESTEASLALDHSVLWTVEPQLSASPKRVFFRRSDEGGLSAQVEVTVSRHDGASFRIGRIDVSRDGILCGEALANTSKSHRLVVALRDRGEALSARGFGEISITTNDDSAPSLRLPVYWIK